MRIRAQAVDKGKLSVNNRRYIDCRNSTLGKRLLTGGFLLSIATCRSVYICCRQTVLISYITKPLFLLPSSDRLEQVKEQAKEEPDNVIKEAEMREKKDQRV